MSSVISLGSGITSSFPDISLGSWFVLRTKSRQEKILAGELKASGLGCFLPLVSCPRFYAGRKVTVEMPLFPGYLFLRGDKDDAYAADRKKRVAQILTVYDQQALETELSGLHQALCVNCTLNPYPYLKKGVRVCVRSGPLRGLEGQIEDLGKRDRLILQVEMLGKATYLEIDGALLDVIDEQEQYMPNHPHHPLDRDGDFGMRA